MIAIEVVLCLLAGAMLVPVVVLTTQVLMALPAHRPRAMPDARRPVLAIVVPAHDEATSIGTLVRRILPRLAAGDRLLVVADNCVDGTARIAVEAGAEVLERNDPDRRGKGYALDFGVRHLERDPPEVVVMVDADCDIGDDAIERISRSCVASGRPVQALYLMHSPRGAGLKTRVAEFAWLVKNHVRALGYHRLGLPCQLMGTGMAFPWSVIRSAELASGHIVEDLKLGIDLARAGARPLFCPEARVTSQFPATAEGIAGQRARWEHGHLGVVVDLAPRLFLDVLRRRDLALLAVALDLCVPPLALLALLLSALFVSSLAFGLTTGSMLALWLTTAALVLFGSSILLSWARYGAHVISFASLAYVPFYALRKVPLYCRFLVGRQVEWVRSKRDQR